MNYVVFAYSIILLLSTYFGHRKKLGVSTISLVLVFILCFSGLFGLFYLNIFLKISISIILLLISINFFSDRKKSGKKINYTHHFVRLLIHLLMIWCLFS